LQTYLGSQESYCSLEHSFLISTIILPKIIIFFIMTHQQQLADILKNEEEKAIIPFLKTLSKVERKALAPAVKKQNKYYTQFIEYQPGSWKSRCTDVQRKILRTAGYLCYNQKDYANLIGWVDPELIDAIKEFYIPEWLGRYINSFAVKDWIPNSLSYLWMVNKAKTSLLQPEPILLAKLLCEAIYKSTPLNRHWTYRPESLEIYEVTLQEHFWLLFQYETNIYHTNRWKFFNGEKKEEYNWIKTILNLEFDNKLPRARLLKESITATTQSFNRNLINWYIDLFTALQPTEEELIPLQADLFNALHGSQTKPINAVLKICKSLVKNPAFNAASFLEFGTQLLTSETKSIVKSTLILLEKIARKNPNLCDSICQLTCSAFSHTDEATQVRAAKIIAKYGDKENDALTEELQLYIPLMKSESKTILKDYICQLETVELEDTPLYEKENPLQAANQLPIIQNADDLVFLLSQALDGNETWHFDMVLAAIIGFHSKMTTDLVDKLAPVFQRAYKILYNHQWNRKQGNTDHLLAIFLAEYMELLLQQFDTLQLKTLKKEQAEKEQIKAKRWTWYKSPKVRLKTWKVHYSNHLFIPIRDLLITTLDKLKKGNLLPLLSTPTHSPCWIDPVVYVQRLSLSQQAELIPSSMDWQIAISRISFEDTTVAIQLAKKLLRGELLEMTLFLLDKNKRAIAIQQFPEEWTVCAYTKNPDSLTTLLPVASSLQEQQVLLGQEPYQFTKKKVWSTRYNYTKNKSEKVEVENKRLTIGSENKPHLLQKLYNLFLTKTRRKGILHQYFTYDDNYLQLTGLDTPRLLYLMPNNVQPLLRTLCKSMFKFPEYSGEEEKRRLVKTTEALLQIGQGSNNMSHLFLANTLVGPDKSARILAAEVILKGISEETIQLPVLGKMLGEIAAINFFPFKRLTDILADHLVNISTQHNQAIETMITYIIKELPTTPIRGTKQLLSIYKELRAMNTSSILEELVQEKLEAWKSSPSLKKLSGQLIGFGKVA